MSRLSDNSVIHPCCWHSQAVFLSSVELLSFRRHEDRCYNSCHTQMTWNQHVSKCSCWVCVIEHTPQLWGCVDLCVCVQMCCGCCISLLIEIECLQKHGAAAISSGTQVDGWRNLLSSFSLLPLRGLDSLCISLCIQSEHRDGDFIFLLQRSWSVW